MTRVAKTLFFGGNWKAAMTPAKTRAFFEALGSKIGGPEGRKIFESGTKVVLSPPSASLVVARQAINEIPALSTAVELAVQDPWIASGAYTGATTFEDALDPAIGARYAVIGHSELREPWRIIAKALEANLESDGLASAGDQIGSIAASILEQLDVDGAKPLPFRLALDAIVNAQVKKALDVDMIPILCVGETLEEREKGRTLDVVRTQLQEGLRGLWPETIRRAVVAYEPVWAIGTGETATPTQAQEVHADIDAWLVANVMPDHRIPIIYGGSMKPGNVADLVSQPDIYGGLIGGASLDAEVFAQLILNGIEALEG